MLRRRNCGKETEEAENVAVSRKELGMENAVLMAGNRAPLVAIQDPHSEVKEVGDGSRLDKTPKRRGGGENGTRTPEKYGGFSVRNRFGWGLKSDGVSGLDNGILPNMTPKSMRSLGRTSSGLEENVVQVTPTKSVNKPPTVRKVDGNGNGRFGAITGLYRNLTVTPVQHSAVSSVEVPHFDLKEDPSFWMDHNVQVLIRIRPLNEMEKRTQGYSRCLKQESAQTIAWIGPPEARFTFDHVACETVDQDTLFRMAGLPMVENCLSGYNSCMFAYGQTGSGKTYTMLGEVDELQSNPSPHRGMTSRVFEFLFARIQAEEEARKEEKLKYSCKCSFLEIYNEQVTDLLDPSATNLHLREDMKKGVYVENLTEFEVTTVSDILMLLRQGASNRKVAATNMNRESSRSHSVFTCVIESQWVKETTNNLRFARLNLVDLAGSERQKSSGAEGDRLKEAASINKSLSTLGHVIMVLLEVAHGKPKHVPYRDSKLTFLLQDSLGGNSKTMIIANVSPATCCATETLNTLKFAQRAKLIQNNAVVNEDSSGDVTALRQQIQMLKDELVALKRQNVLRSLSFKRDNIEEKMAFQYQEEGMQKTTQQMLDIDSTGAVRMSRKQLNYLETTLAGSLRREQMAESSIKQLEAEIEHLNRLVRQREEDSRSSKMMLKFRDDKISRMESLVNNTLPVDSYLSQENKALSEEIHLLSAKLNRNPEVTRFALENIRLLDQIRRFQDFYEEGEKEMLLSEVSDLRQQLLRHLDGNTVQPCSPPLKTPPKNGIHEANVQGSINLQLQLTSSELEECRSNLRDCLEENEKLNREISSLQKQLIDHPFSTPIENKSDYELSTDKTEELLDLKLELDIFKVILQQDMLYRIEAEEKTFKFMSHLESARENISLMTKKYTDTEHELHNSKSAIEALESQQILLINEIDDLKTSNNKVLEHLYKREAEILDLKKQVSGYEHSRALSLSRNYENEDLPIQTKLTKMQESLEKAKNLNIWYQKDLVNHNTSSEEMENIRRQAEVETAEVIVSLQEELSVLQQQIEERNLLEIDHQEKIKLLEDQSKELQQKLLVTTQECTVLDEQLEQKDREIHNLCAEWRLLTSVIEEVLYDGNESLNDASSEVCIISNSFPKEVTLITEQVIQMAKTISAKENLIEKLNRSLEDANIQIGNLDVMLKSLKGAALVINDSHQKEFTEKEKKIDRLCSELSYKSCSMSKLDLDIQLSKEYTKKLSICATAAFVIVSNLTETKKNLIVDIKQKDALISELEHSIKATCLLADNQAVALVEADNKICFLHEELNDVKAKCKELDDVVAYEKEQACYMSKKLQAFKANEILKTEEKLTELQAGVSAVMLSIGLCDSLVSNSKNIDTTHCLPVKGIDNNTAQSAEMTVLRETSHEDYTLSLLRKEIEFALESLTVIRVEMAKLHREKEIAMLSEKKSQQNMDSLQGQVIAMQNTMINFEELTGVKMALVEDKLQSVEDATACWAKSKELFETQLIDAKTAAAQKAAEVETLNVDRVNKVHEMQRLQSTNDMLNHQIEVLEKQLEKDLTDTKGALLELEDTVLKVQNQIHDDFESLLYDISGFKNYLFDAKNVKRSLFEDIWSEIMVTGRAVSVLHLCHSGLLLDSVVRENVENGLLQLGLSEQHSITADLKEHNNKARDSLAMCRRVEGKLLTGIRQNFDRVRELDPDLKLATFEQLTPDLQAQDDTMLRKSDDMGCKLANLMSELEKSNSSAMSVLLEHGKLLKDSQTDTIFMETLRRDVQILVCASKFKDVAVEAADSESERFKCLSMFENLKEELFLSRVDGNLKDFLLEDLKDQLTVLTYKSTKLENERNHLSSMVKTTRDDMEMANKKLRLLEEVAQSHDLMKNELDEAIIMKGSLLSKMHALDQELKEKDAALEISTILISNLIEKNQKAEAETILLKVTYSECRSHLEMKNGQTNTLEDENQSLRNELTQMQKERCLISEDLNTFCSRSTNLEEENLQLHNMVAALEFSIGGLKNNMYMKQAEVSELEESISLLKHELDSLKKRNFEILSNLSINNMKSNAMLECANERSSVINRCLNQGIGALEEKILLAMSDSPEMATQFMKDISLVEAYACTLLSANECLQRELSRKDETLKELQFDLSVLQESGSKINYYQDDLKEMSDSLKEKIAVISTLKMHVEEEYEKVQLLSREKAELVLQLEDGIEQKNSIEAELTEKKALIDSLESEVLKMNRTLIDAYNTIESMHDNLDVVTREKDHLQSNVLLLEEKLDMAEAHVLETEAIATEAKQMAASGKFYFEEKEVEIRLLERSIEELESTIDVLENKVEIVKGEAERQRIQREELELELHALKNQTLNVEFSNTDIRRHLNEKEAVLEDTLQRVHVLERELSSKDTEIDQLKTHISELNVHADAQACEYKQKFKALESMAEKVKLESSSGHGTGTSSNKLERNASKPRGSGSPFKCIGLGLGQQIKSEKEEDLTDAKHHIQELEALAANRQKEIFMLKSRLATAESMTHDVIRELLGVKLDMTQYASLLDADNKTEKSLSQDVEPQMMDEVAKLKKQLNEFIEERKGWLDEIDRKHSELVSAKMSLEKLHQANQSLKAENQTLVIENNRHKKQVIELEREVDKLSGQQNLQQRIHHHAKVKEENNFLRSQNEDLSLKLRRAENILSRVKEELEACRAYGGKSRHFTFDDQERLTDKLKDTEEEKLQLAQRLISLCTSILKVAGITGSDITIDAAEEALGCIQNQMTSLKRDMEDLKFKNKITKERSRLSELMPQLSSLSPMSQTKSQTPGRVSNAPFLSTLDR